MIFFLILGIKSIISSELSTSRDHLKLSGNSSITRDYIASLSASSTVITCIIEDGITEIGPSSFFGFSVMKVCQIPNSVQLIGSNAFYDCSELTFFYIPEGVSVISTNTLYRTPMIEEISFPSTLTHFDFTWSFYMNRALKKIMVASNSSTFSTDKNNEYLMNKNQTVLFASVSKSVLRIPQTIEIISSFFSYERIVETIDFSSVKNLKRIDNNAFRYSTNLATLSPGLPEGLQYIGDSAFYMTKISTLTIPSTAETVDVNSFRGMNYLQTIYTAPGSSNFYADGNALYGKKNTQLLFILPTASSLTIPSTVTEIPLEVIQQSNLESISAPDHTNFTVFDNVLYCNNNTTLLACPRKKITAKIHTKCKTISESAFYKTNIEKVEFEGNEVTKLLSRAFSSSKLKSIELKEGVETLSEYSFYCCSQLTSVILPSTITSIGPQCFYNSKIKALNMSICKGLEYISSQNFELCTSLENMYLPPHLSSMGSSLCKNCTVLKTISIPKFLRIIPERAFYGCTSLKSVIFETDSKTVEFGKSCFAESGIISIKIPDSCQKIGELAFSECYHLSDLYVSDDSNLSIVMSIAFYHTNLTKIFLGKQLAVITPTAFTGADKLMEIKISENNINFVSINGIVFSKNKTVLIACPCGIETVIINNNILSFAPNAFYQCTKLTTVIFEDPSAIKEIGQMTFAGCPSLINVNLPNSVQRIGLSAFADCIKLENFNITECSNLTIIDDKAFSNCSLKSFNFHNIKTIGSSSFDKCRIKKAVLPLVVDIGNLAFSKCSELISVKIGNKIASEGIKVDSFSGCSNLIFFGFCGRSSSSTDFLHDCPVSTVFVSVLFTGQKVSGKSVRIFYDSDCQVPTERFSLDVDANQSQIFAAVSCVQMCDEGDCVLTQQSYFCIQSLNK